MNTTTTDAEHTVKLPELLAPAGDMEKLITAVHYGADAVYLGGSSYSLRAGAGRRPAGRFADGRRL